ncbi:hypothetical protein IW140_006639 [Coemansia sp. RSA 1813]|nr:hypothetical protein IW140_006639 [Coemansia sp. RSA 1813]
MARDFQCVIGNETKEQLKALAGRLPDTLVACAGGGTSVLLAQRLRATASTLPGIRQQCLLGPRVVFHGAKTYLLQGKKGRVMETHSIAAGLSYPGVGPEHSWLKATGRAEYHAVTDAQALEGLRSLAKLEGIVPSLEASHTVYQAMQVASAMSSNELLVICISGNGDKGLS